MYLYLRSFTPLFFPTLSSSVDGIQSGPMRELQYYGLPHTHGCVRVKLVSSLPPRTNSTPFVFRPATPPPPPPPPLSSSPRFLSSSINTGPFQSPSVFRNSAPPMFITIPASFLTPSPRPSFSPFSGLGLNRFSASPQRNTSLLELKVRVSCPVGSSIVGRRMRRRKEGKGKQDAGDRGGATRS